MDITQIVVVISLLSISAIVVAVGVYFIKLIQELRITVGETNQILGAVSRPVNSFSEFLMGFRNGFSLFNSFFKKEKDKE